MAAVGGAGDEKDMEDPLLRLPREVLISILSLLPTKQVVRMSSLSEAWRHLDINLLLSCLPNLMFECRYESRCHQESMVKAIKSSLRLGPEPASLGKLRIELSLKRMESPSLLIDSWIKAALERKVKEFDLSVGLYNQSYHLPAKLFVPSSSIAVLSLNGLRLEAKLLSSATTITDLTLNDCQIEIWGDINLGLRRLSLIRTGDRKSIRKLLSCCPLLETLRIAFNSFKKLQIFGHAQLRRLDVHSCQGLKRMEIQASSLEYLSCDHLNDRYSKPLSCEIVFSHCESLKELLLVDSRVCEDLVQHLSSTLPNLEKLHIGDSGLQRIEVLHPNLKQLEIARQYGRKANLKIDTPNLHSFGYEGSGMPLLPLISP